MGVYVFSFLWSFAVLHTLPACWAAPPIYPSGSQLLFSLIWNWGSSNPPKGLGVVLVPKSDGSIRFCVDYCLLNDHMASDSYPRPLNDDLLACLAGARYVTTLDPSKGYWQIPLTVEGREHSAFITPLWTIRVP